MSYFNEQKHMGILFRDINNTIVTLLNKDLEQYGITLMQNEILTYIYFYAEKQNINQKDIERFFNSTNPTITGILNRLQAKGLIIRRPSIEDARYKIIELTEKGKNIVIESHTMKVNKMEQRIVENLSNEEEKELKRLLGKVLKGLKDEKVMK